MQANAMRNYFVFEENYIDPALQILVKDEDYH